MSSAKGGVGVELAISGICFSVGIYCVAMYLALSAVPFGYRGRSAISIFLAALAGWLNRFATSRLARRHP